MNTKIFPIFTVSIMLLAGCQNVQPIISSTPSASVREDSALYNQMDLFAVKNGGVVQKNSDGLTLLTPFFNEDIDYISQAEMEYLQKLGVFLTGTTIKQIRIIGYIERQSNEEKMTKTLEDLRKMFSTSGVAAPIKLTIGYPVGQQKQEKRFQFDITTN
jgi:hypothetical protein